MTEKSHPWDGEAVGDATVAPYDSLEWQHYWARSFTTEEDLDGVRPNYLNELNATGVASPVAIDTGAAMVAGCDYKNDASLSVAVANPAVSTRIDRIVLRRTPGTQTARIVLITGVEGSGTPPALTHVNNGTWEIPLWRLSITTGGVITLTDERHFLLYDSSMIADGRLTLTSGTPVTTADVSAATTLYYSKYKGNRILLPTAHGGFNILTFEEPSISLVGLTASTVYDIFAHDSSGVVTLSAVAWASSTARSVALTRNVLGFYVNSGSLEKRYIGTIYINATGGQTDDTVLKRFVWNCYNRVQRRFYLYPNANWNYNSAVARQIAGNANNKFEFVDGLGEEIVWANYNVYASVDTTESCGIGFGLDTIASFDADCVSGVLYISGARIDHTVITNYLGNPGIGFHTLYPLETVSAGTVGFFATTDGGKALGVING